jgi:5-methylcytosine-specific restriction endonuclease McrA
MDRKEYMRQYQLRWIAARRQAWFDENGPCVKCGSTNNLEADHIDPKTKLYFPRVLWSMSDKNPKKISELAKLQVLCEDCHREKSNAGLATSQHGRTMYENYGCRCDICKEAKRRNNAKRYQPV